MFDGVNIFRIQIQMRTLQQNVHTERIFSESLTYSHRRFKNAFNSGNGFTLNFFVETPFKCEHCPDEFMTKMALTSHVKRQCQPLTCITCRKSFTKQSSLTNHIKYVIVTGVCP